MKLTASIHVYTATLFALLILFVFRVDLLNYGPALTNVLIVSHSSNYTKIDLTAKERKEKRKNNRRSLKENYN